MPELTTVTRSSAAIVAGRKTDPTNSNRKRSVIIETAPTYAAPLSGDTIASGIVLPKGTRICAGPTLSNAANAASVTLAVGLRDATTKVAIDATAIMAATAITTAATAQVNTGTKLNAGQFYVLPQDAEIYLTIGGATGTANAAIRVEVDYIAP